MHLDVARGCEMFHEGLWFGTQGGQPPPVPWPSRGPEKLAGPVAAAVVLMAMAMPVVPPRKQCAKEKGGEMEFKDNKAVGTRYD